MHRFCVFIVTLILLGSCACELSLETRDKFVNGFIGYLNNLPNQAYVFDEGALVKADNVADNTYKIEANVKASDLHNVDSVKYLQCTTTLLDLGEIGVSILRNEHHCSETPGDVTVTDAVTVAAEDVVERRPVQLDNEIQSASAITSGEQFIAIPRDHPAPCIGCSTKVDPRAEGVTDLAGLCVRHLDRHEPSVKHTLAAVLDVERQVQIVNGVRYILTITVGYNNCTETETEGCNFEKPCKVTVLEKPWVKLPDGSKYRAILANNCTQQWLFGDNGEVLPMSHDNNNENNEINVNPFNDDDQVDQTNGYPNKPTPDYDKIANTGSVDDILKVVYNVDLQAQPIQKELTQEQMTNLQEQIIPLDKFNQYSHANDQVIRDTAKESVETQNKENIDKIETEIHVSDTSLPIRQPDEKGEVQASLISEEKKRTIDELMNLFKFPGVNSKTEGIIKKRHVRDLTDEFEKRESDPIQDQNKSRKNRQVPGGATELDPSDPEIITLADESVAKYLETSGNKNPHKVLEITKATKQVVAGTLKKIDFRVSPTNETLGGAFDCHSEIWEQPWLKKKEITVNCGPNVNKARKKRGLVGGPTEVDPSDPEIKTLAEESVAKYLEISGNKNPHKVLEITKATIQVVAGTLKKIDFKVCPTNESLGGAFDCHSEIWERPWLKKKEITVNCGPDAKKSRKKRENLTGGPTEVDPSKPEYRTLAEESLAKYLETSGNKSPHKVVDVTKVTVQLVAGTVTDIIFKVSPSYGTQVFKCHSKIWNRPWLKSKEINVTCEVDEMMYGKNQRIVGSVTKGDPSNPKYKMLAQESLSAYLKMSGKTDPHKIETITKVSEQMVAGTLTKIEFLMCPNLYDSDGTICEDEVFECRSEIWETPWTKSKDIKVNCSTYEGPGGGGLAEQDPSDPKYKALAEESLTKYLETSGNKYHHKVIDIQNVTLQIVAGTLTRIDFRVSPTNCQRDINVTTSDCKIQGDAISCHSEVWEQVWINKKEITVNCSADDIDINKSRVKRQSEAPIEKDPKLQMYRQQAEKALHKYLILSNNNKIYKVVEVTKVTQQASQGLTTIHFKASSVNEKDLYCKSEILVQVQNNVGEITVNCNEDTSITELNPSKKTDTSPDEPKETMPGEPVKKNPKEPHYKKLAEESLSKYLETCGSKDPHKIIDVTKVTVQVVSGTLTTIHFTVSYTLPFDEYCDHCSQETQEAIKYCKSLIWERVWLNIKEITVNCSADGVNKPGLRTFAHPKDKNTDYTKNLILKNSGPPELKTYILQEYIIPADEQTKRKKREVSGGVTEKDGSRSTYKTLAEEQEKRHIDGQPFFDETMSHVNTASDENAIGLAEEALKHIEAKYPHPRRQKVVRIFSLEKQAVAGVHYRLKMEIGNTDCMALSIRSDCELVNSTGPNRFCRVNIWIRPGEDHPAIYRVACDHQEQSLAEMYRHIQAQELFKDFIARYKPDYTNDDVELSKRFEIFKTNVRKIHYLNIYERGTGKYGVTRFTDLSGEEFRRRHLGLDISLRDRNAVPMRQADIPSVEIPDHFDWRDLGAVTEVKNQGSCGSCWAFSVTGNIEGQWKKRSGKLVSLSEQELVDCDTLDHGCNGGLPDNAYRAIEQLGGLELESDYPYEGDDEKCSFNKTLSRVQISGAVNISSNETDMAKWLVGNGPISIGINANAMQFYVGGVSHPWKVLCNPGNLDHGVLIVGYGVKDYPLFHKRLPYWIVKNSWGTMWGEQGYYRVYRGDGTCGVNMMASSAIV